MLMKLTPDDKSQESDPSKSPKFIFDKNILPPIHCCFRAKLSENSYLWN
jgi:hypothetical protein